MASLALSTSVMVVCGALLAPPAFEAIRRPPASPAEGFRVLRPLPVIEGSRRAQKAAWKRERSRLLEAWQGRLGPFPDRVPLETSLVSDEALADHRRLRVRYRLDAETAGEAYLLVPLEKSRRRRPGMVVLHQTANESFREPVGLTGREPMHLALHLVRRGYVCVAPQNYLWSEPEKGYAQVTRDLLRRPPWKTGMARMLRDAMRATDLLAERPEVDPRRIGSIGHSLGGKEVLYHAAFDPRVRAAVSCEGGIGLTFSNWDAEWYLGGQVREPGFAADHHEILSLVAPRPFLLIGGESADGARSWPYVEAALPVWRLHDAGERLGLLRHGFGHDFPPPGPDREAIYGWLDFWMEHRSPAKRPDKER